MSRSPRNLAKPKLLKTTNQLLIIESMKDVFTCGFIYTQVWCYENLCATCL